MVLNSNEYYSVPKKTCIDGTKEMANYWNWKDSIILNTCIWHRGFLGWWDDWKCQIFNLNTAMWDCETGKLLNVSHNESSKRKRIRDCTVHNKKGFQIALTRPPGHVRLKVRFLLESQPLQGVKRRQTTKDTGTDLGTAKVTVIVETDRRMDNIDLGCLRRAAGILTPVIMGLHHISNLASQIQFAASKPPAGSPIRS